MTNVGEAVGVLVQAAEIATKAGIFSLGEAKFIIDAVEFLMPDYFKQGTPEGTVPEVEPTEPVTKDLKEQAEQFELKLADIGTKKAKEYSFD